MKLEDIKTLPFDKMVDRLAVDSVERDIDLWRNEYKGEHKILVDPERAPKTVGPDNDRRTVDPAKLTIPFQKKVVNLAVAFLFGEPPKLSIKNDDADPDAFDQLLDVYEDNKIEYFNRRLMREVCVESKAAELWWATLAVDDEGNQETKIKVMLLSKKEGFEIFAHFDDKGDFDAFTVLYETTELIDGKGKKMFHADVYTAQTNYFGKKISTEWKVDPKPNLYGKIPVIYHDQEEPEWADVQRMMDRFEYVESRHADANDYNGQPMLVAKGDIKTMPSKTEDGKLIQLKGKANPQTGATEYGSVDYLTWDQAPESIKLEYNNLKDLIYSMTSTPDISFQNMKGIGPISGVALRLMFLDAILKSKNKQEIFGEGLIRRNNLLKAILSVTDYANAEKYKALKIAVEFQSPIPQDILEMMNTLSIGRAGEATMSEETALQHNPLVDDVDQEIERLKEEKSENEINRMAGSFNFGGGNEVGNDTGNAGEQENDNAA